MTHESELFNAYAFSLRAHKHRKIHLYHFTLKVLTMESVLLTSLQFNLSAATPWEFARRYCGAAKLGSRINMLANFMMELFMQEPAYLEHTPSKVAASAIYLSQLCCLQDPWVSLAHVCV